MKKPGYKMWQWWAAAPLVLVSFILIWIAVILVFILDWVRLIDAEEVNPPKWFDKLVNWGIQSGK